MREAVINAIVHNDYTHEIPPKFEIFADRIEITSAGSLPDNISYNEFFEGISVPRNKELMRIFKDLDLVEQLGSGIPRILETYGRDCVNFTGNFIRMSFNAAGNVHEISDEDENTNLKQTSGLVDGLVDRLVDELVESQKLILKLIEENPKISKREMSEKIGISSNAVDKNLKTLKSKQIIRRAGNDKTGYWEILDGLVDGLVDSQKQILKLIEENPKISKREMSEKIGISSNAVDKNLKTLKSKQIIRRKGNDKTGYWEVLYVNF